MKRLSIIILTIAVFICVSCTGNDIRNEGDHNMQDNQDSTISESIKTDNVGMIEVDQQTILYTQIDSVFDHNKVTEDLQKMKMLEFCKTYQIKNYKSIQDTKYIVMKTTEGLLWISFDERGSYTYVVRIIFSDESSQENLENVAIGSTAETIREIDPDGQHPYSYHNWSGFPAVSFHFYENGDSYAVFYKENTVIDIIKFII